MNTTPQSTGDGAHSNRPEAGYQFFSWIRSTGLYRPDGAWVGGVLAALAQKMGWDSNLVRGLGVVALILFASPSLLFYGLGWLLLPDARGRIHAQEAIRGSYPSGLWGAGIVAFLGAVNVFTPNVVGPFAILLNLVIIGVVAWVIWLLVSNHRGDSEKSTDPKARSSRPEGDGSDAAEHQGPGGSPRRQDGKPAWYPREEAAPEPKPEPAATARTGSFPAGSAPAVFAPEPAEPEEDPVEAEHRRRRRLVTFGLLLLAVPAVGGAAWIATQIGLATTSAVLLGLAAVVILLALMHLTSALRGTPGRGGLLATFTGLMMLVYFMAPIGTSSNHVFGNYTTTGSEVNTAFGNTVVDLRHLSFDEADAVDIAADHPNGELPQDSFHSWVDVNNAFGNTFVVVPDDVYVEVDPNTLFGNVEIHTVDAQQDQSGFGVNSFGAGSDEAIGAVGINANNAFGNVTVYDATTYAEQELDDAEDEDELEDAR